MANLAQRLQKVQQPETAAVFDFSHLSMDQLETSKIKFGKTHVGKSYLHMWTREQKWVLWFTQHYAQSQKYDHRMFLYYVEKKIERCELTGMKVSLNSATEEIKAAQSSNPHGVQPKAKPQMGQTGKTPVEDVPATVWDYEEDPELFEMLPEAEPVWTASTEDQMELRMASVENALSRIITFIEQNTSNQISEQ